MPVILEMSSEMGKRVNCGEGFLEVGGGESATHCVAPLGALVLALGVVHFDWHVGHRVSLVQVQQSVTFVRGPHHQLQLLRMKLMAGLGRANHISALGDGASHFSLSTLVRDLGSLVWNYTVSTTR